MNPITSAASFNPRLPSSRQWTNLPADLLGKIKTVFEQQFPIEADHGEFFFEGRIYPAEIMVRMGYLEKGRLKQLNFEASVDLPMTPSSSVTPSALQTDEEESSSGAASATHGESKVMQRLYMCIDALGSIAEEYFEVGEEDEIDLPLRWQAFEFEGQTVWLQHSTINTKLEEEADRLLGLNDDRLFHETEEGEDALEKAEVNSELALDVQKAIRQGKYKFDPETGKFDPAAGAQLSQAENEVVDEENKDFLN